MRKLQKTPYRLGINLGVAPVSDNPSASSCYGFIGWSVVQLARSRGELFDAGECTDLDGIQIDRKAVAEVSVIVYEHTEDMLEPMSREAFEARLQQALAKLPAGVIPVAIPFAKDAYRAWLNGQPDTHQRRAMWAAEQP